MLLAKFIVSSWLFLSFVRAQRSEEEVPNYLRIPDSDFAQFADDEDHRINYRLNDDTWPSYYKLHIDAFYDPQVQYSGEVHITFAALVATNQITMNQQEITLQSSALFALDENNNRVEELSVGCNLNNTYEKLICDIPEMLLPSRMYQITLSYTGKVHNDMRGFYQSYYKANDGSKKTLGSTHFGQQARRLLPCWDEPRFKAHFEISVRRNSSIYTSSVTNGKLLRTEVDEINQDIVVDYHAVTSLIPAYILALVVSDFDVRSSDSPNYSIYARPNAIEQTKFVYDLLPKLTVAFDFWTKIYYYEFDMVDKLDMAAIPDFSAGG